MQDRPTYDELLARIERFLDEEVVPNLEGSRGFHARVAANAVRIVRREMESEDEVLASEWAGLDAILGATERPAGRADLREALRERNAELCAQIRRGDADEAPRRDEIVEHIRRAVHDKLRVTNPELLERS